MKKSICYRVISLIMIFALSLTCACGKKTIEQADTGEKPGTTAQKPVGMLPEGQIEYTKEEMLPQILVDLTGYEIGRDKIAIVYADTLFSEFEIRNADDDRMVYSGRIISRNIENIEDAPQMIAAEADFTDFDQAGVYYIYSQMLGKSKVFTIHQQNRAERVKDVLKSIHQLRNDDGVKTYAIESGDKTLTIGGGWRSGLEQQDVVEGCVAVLDMLMAYEYHGNIYTDDFGIKESGNGISDLIDEIEFELRWLQKMQNTETGGVYTGIYVPEGSDTPLVLGETTKATAYACTAFARFSYLCAKADPSFAQTCLEQATLAWKCLSLNKEIVTSDQYFRAAVEMFRATGLIEYAAEINSYLEANSSKEFESRTALDGAISYMATSKGTNLDYCNLLMKTFMNRTENKSNLARNSAFYVEPDQDTNGLLRNMTELVMADYIISNSEYGSIEEEYLHYICGRNKESIDYSKRLTTVDEYAQLLILVGKLYDDIEMNVY